MKEYCFVWDTASDELEDLYELEKSYALSGEVSIVLFNLQYSSRRARAQASCAHDVVLRSDIENAISFMSSLMAFGAHSHIFASTLCSSTGARASVRG